MIYVPALSSADQRALHHLQRRGPSAFRQRAQMVLLSAQGWSVPAIARAMACCRRTVRHWLHAFLDQGLAGLQGRPRGRSAQSEQAPVSLSAKDLLPTQVPLAGRYVPVIELTVPEVRRLLSLAGLFPQLSPEHSWRWSVWRRYKQALAKRSHYRKRGTQPPAFFIMWLPAA